MAKDDILYFRPLFKERIWGGDALKKLYGKSMPEGNVGEAWIVSAIPGSESVVAAGKYAGRTLADLYRHDRDLFPAAAGEFPLLTKIIDARDRLSVQVHPDDAFAQKYERQSGKTECWYVMDAVPGAELVIGHFADTRQELHDAAADGSLESLLASIPVETGDFIYVPAGTLHAIGAGILILENQQSSDVTYRIYDYNRVDPNGNPRQLHLGKGIAVTDVPAKRPYFKKTAMATGLETLIETPQFTIRHLVVDGVFHDANPKRRWYLGTVVAGRATLNGHPVVKGEAFVITAAVEAIDVTGKCEVILAFVDPEVLS